MFVHTVIDTCIVTPKQLRLKLRKFQIIFGRSSCLPILNKIPTFLGQVIQYYSSKGSDRLKIEKKNETFIIFFRKKLVTKNNK